MSPASAPSMSSLSDRFETVKTSNGLRAGIWSREILPESVSSTSALGTELVEYSFWMYAPRLLVMKSLTAFWVGILLSEEDAPPSVLESSKPVTTTSPPFSFKNSTSEMVTVPVKVIAPVLFSILANVPTLKSPSSSVPETYTRP